MQWYPSIFSTFTDTEYKIEINVNYNGQLIQTEFIDDKIMTLSTPIIYEDDAHEEIDA